ncbi:hypothetical protein Tco_1035107 [Tanacetum coccineum]
MERGLLDSNSKAKNKDGGKEHKCSMLGGLAKRVKNINGKLVGKDGKPLVAARNVRDEDTKVSTNAAATTNVVEQIVINTKVVDDVCTHNTDFGTSYSQPECAADGAADMSKNMAGSFENVAGNEGMEANVSGMESQQANKSDNDQTCDVLGDKVVRSVIFDTQGGDASGHGDGSEHVYVGNPPKKSILKKSNVAARHIDNTQELFVSVRGQQRSHVGLKSVKNDPKDAGNLMQEESIPTDKECLGNSGFGAVSSQFVPYVVNMGGSADCMKDVFATNGSDGAFVGSKGAYNGEGPNKDEAAPKSFINVLRPNPKPPVQRFHFRYLANDERVEKHDIVLPKAAKERFTNRFANSLDDEPGYTTEIIQVEFEWKPPHCVECKIFGHRYDKYLKRKADPIHTDRPMDEQAVGFTTNLAAKTFISVVNHEEGFIEITEYAQTD